MFSGWPANGGAWSWGDEILVSFNHGFYKFYGNTHNIDREREMFTAFARSRDGGESWSFYTVPGIFDREIVSVPDGGFTFDENFVLRIGRPAVGISGDTYIVSADRGETWTGPYAFPKMENELTSRTCYILEGTKRMLLFASWKDPGLTGMSYSDQSFPMLTGDGGQTWQKLGMMTENDARAVMASVVRRSDGTLAAALRRKIDSKTPAVSDEEAARLRAEGSKVPTVQDNWIEVVSSSDNGLTWSFCSRAAETSHEMGRNGNPPALVQTGDGRLVLFFGYRGKSPAIKARVSPDGGYTWGDEIIIRDDALTHDIGYPRAVVRPDGKIVVMYYFTSEKMKEQHIEATILEV